MATGEQLKALLKSHLAGDDDLFRSVALQIAAHEATKGNDRLAKELRDMVEKLHRVQQPTGTPRAVPIARASGELAGLVTASYPSTRLADMVLASNVRHHIDDIIHQHRQRDLLGSHGLLPKRKLLLVGPPGCGKTMTASVLAHECELPLLSVQLHSLITKYMGETAAKLHLLFDAMSQTKGVYLFDEFDAIGATRTAGNDVGEIRRILNSFLLFLEKDESESIIVAATNFSGMLDGALFRRFDDVIEYGLPDATSIRTLIESRLSIFDVSQLKWPIVEKAAKGLSHAEVGRVCDDAARATILAGRMAIDGDSFNTALRRRSGMRPRRSRNKRTAMADLPHLRIEGTEQSAPYTNVAAGPVGAVFSLPARNQPVHARRIRTELDAADAAGQSRRAADASTHPELVHWVPEGLVLTFRSDPGHELKLERLEDRRRGILLLSLAIVDGCDVAKVFVPEGQLRKFLTAVDRYAADVVLVFTTEPGNADALKALQDSDRGIRFRGPVHKKDGLAKLRFVMPESEVAGFQARVGSLATLVDDVPAEYRIRGKCCLRPTRVGRRLLAGSAAVSCRRNGTVVGSLASR